MPMPLARFHTAFSDWIFEPKLDGFRAVAYVGDSAAQVGNLVRPVRTSQRDVTDPIHQHLPGCRVVDGVFADERIIRSNQWLESRLDFS